MQCIHTCILYIHIHIHKVNKFEGKTFAISVQIIFNTM